MTVREILSQVVEQTPGALAGAVMAADGIPVEEYARKGVELDLSTLAVEFHRVVEQAGKVAGSLYGEEGALQELLLATAQSQVLFRPVDDEFFLVLALGPDGVLGKARFLIRRLLHELQEEL